MGRAHLRRRGSREGGEEDRRGGARNDGTELEGSKYYSTVQKDDVCSRLGSERETR